MIFPGFGAAASTGLIRKNRRGRIVGQQVHSTVSINTIYPNAFVYILFLSFPSIFENYSARGAAGFENILISTTIGCLCMNREAWGFEISSEK